MGRRYHRSAYWWTYEEVIPALKARAALIRSTHKDIVGTEESKAQKAAEVVKKEAAMINVAEFLVKSLKSKTVPLHTFPPELKALFKDVPEETDIEVRRRNGFECIIKRFKKRFHNINKYVS